MPRRRLDLTLQLVQLRLRLDRSEDVEVVAVVVHVTSGSFPLSDASARSTGAVGSHEMVMWSPGRTSSCEESVAARCWRMIICVPSSSSATTWTSSPRYIVVATTAPAVLIG